MEKTIKILSKIGLTEKQAIVYCTLLELGEVSMTDIANRAKLKRPTVYLIMDELDMLGLVSIVTKNKKKMYSAIHPKRISELLDFNKNQYQELLPELLARYGNQSNKPKVTMQEGIEGVRHAYREAFTELQNQKEGLWIGNIELLETYFPEVLREYTRMLASIKRYTIREIIFGGEKGKQFVQKMNNNKNHQLKYWDDGDLAGGTDELIIGNKIMTFCFSEKEVFTLITESTEIAKTKKALFETIWAKLP